MSVRPVGPKDYLAILHVLKRDPSLRFTDAGRGVLRWLAVHTIGSNDWKTRWGRCRRTAPRPSRIVHGIVAAAWKELADRLERHDLDARDESA